jgi:hypothetical protein
MSANDFDSAIWRKSSYSGSTNNCVEVADGFSGMLPVRDSKDPNGPVLVFRAGAWQDFVSAVRAGKVPTRL